MDENFASDTGSGQKLLAMLERWDGRRWQTFWLPVTMVGAAVLVSVISITLLPLVGLLAVCVGVIWLLSGRQLFVVCWAAVTAVLLKLADDAVGGASLQLEFAGTAERFKNAAKVVGNELTLSDFGWDFVAVAMYTFGGLIIATGLWTTTNSRLDVRWGIRFAIAIAGLADAAENLCLVAAAQRGPEGYAPVAFVLASLKFTLLTIVVLAAIEQFGRRRLVRPGAVASSTADLAADDLGVDPEVGDPGADTQIDPVEHSMTTSDGPRPRGRGKLRDPLVRQPDKVTTTGIGIACSGGGIRSAAFSLGGLHGLGRKRVGEAEHLSAVSGGSYIASAMTARVWFDPDKYQNELPYAEKSEELAYLRSRSRYLFADSTRGRTGVVRAVFATMINLLFIWLMLFAVLRPAGWLMSSDVLHPELRAQTGAVHDVHLDKKIGPADFVAAPIVSSADTARTCADGTESDLYELRFKPKSELSVSAQVLADVTTSNLDRDFNETAKATPGRVEVCGSTPHLRAVPKLQLTAPLEVTSQLQLSFEVDGGVGPDTTVGGAELVQWLAIDEQPKFGDGSLRNGRPPITIDGWMWALVGIGLFGALLTTTFGRSTLRNSGRPTLRFPISGAIFVGCAVGGGALLIVAPVLLRELPIWIGGGLIDQLTPDSSASGVGAWFALFGTAYATARRLATGSASISKANRGIRFTMWKVMAFAASTVIIVGLAYGVLEQATLNGPHGRIGGLGSTWWSPSQLFLIPDLARWLVVVALLMVLRPLLDVHSWSLQPIYRDRLAHAFFASEATGQALVPAPVETNLGEHVHSSATIGDWPKLTVCATANLNDPVSLSQTSAGRYGQSFIFAEDVIGWPGHYISTSDYADALSKRNSRMLDLESIVAVSGAAFSPAMGKFGFGAIGGLFAILNLRLGLWAPNPAWVAANQGTETWRGKPGWPYLIREIFGGYSAGAQHVYVTDGGHWENLGLVELLRRGCTEIYVISAAGDGRNAFATIGEAIALAREVANIDITVELSPMRPRIGDDGDDGTRQLLDDTVDPATTRPYSSSPFAIGSFQYPRMSADRRFGTGRGVILFVEATLTDDVPWDVQAWAERHPSFPDDTTADQFFDYAQFEAYRRLGQHQMTKAVNSAEWGRALRWRSEEPGYRRP